MVAKSVSSAFPRIGKLAGTLGIAFAIGGGYLLWSRLEPANSYNDNVIKVRKVDIENTVSATGTLQAVRQVDVGTRATGQLTSLKVKLGDVVRTGDLLAEVDPVLSENDLRSAQANFANLEAQKAAAAAKLRRSRLDFEREKDMIKKAATSQREFDTAEAQVLADEANLAALSAQISQAKVQIDIAGANLSYTKIRAPIDGDVVAVMTQEGQTVVAAQIVPVILKLAQLDAMTIKVQISEADIINVKIGQPACFTVMGDQNKHYCGTLRAIEPAPQNFSDPAGSSAQIASNSAGGATAAIFYNALFDVPNPDRVLRIGMTAQVSITLGVSKDVLAIPASALRDQTADGRYIVQVVTQMGRLEKRFVRVGINNYMMAEIVEGLNEGDSVTVRSPPASAERSLKEAGL